MRKNLLAKRLAAGLAVFLAVVSSGTAFAAQNSDFSQVINTGSLSSDILDSSRNPVVSPSVGMSAKNFAFTCQSGGSASTGTFGTNGQRIYVSNPDSADNGWTLTIAATDGATTRWTNSGATQNFDFNDTGGSGCTDGGDTDSNAGQLTLNPAAGTVTTDCTSCTSTGITLGSSAAFNQGTTDNITLVNAAAGSNDVWRGYLTGVTASQTIPAETAADSYSLNLTLTTTAL